MDEVRLGIIGFGNMGTAHAKNICAGKCPEIRLTAVADTDSAKRDLARERLGEDAACFENAESLMDSGLVDAVLVSTPHYWHPPLAMEAMKRGLHVMVEKPAGVYTLQVREMNQAAEKSGVVFGLMFNQRTDPIYRKMKEIMDGGALGALKRVNWIITDWYRTQHYYDSGAWRATWNGEGGGVLLNQCPHQLDLFQWICGLPCRVEARMHFGKWHHIEVEDDVTAYLEFENGATGCFITSTGDAPGSNRFEVDCEKGKMVCEDGRLRLWTLAENERTWCFSSKDGFAKPACVETAVELAQADERHLGHAGVLNAFADAILRGGPLVANGCEGIRGLTLSNAMHLSAFLQRPVDVPFDEELYYRELMKRATLSPQKTQTAHGVADLEGTY